jgi:hypothetical protein
LVVKQVNKAKASGSFEWRLTPVPAEPLSYVMVLVVKDAAR